MFIKIIPAFRRGADTPVETGSPELLRTNLIRRAAQVQLSGVPCLLLTLDGNQTIHCTGTVAQLCDTLNGIEPAVEEEDDVND